MSKNSTKKYTFIYILILLLLFSVSGEDFDLSVQKPSWTAVISGEAVCPPQSTSYGFAVLTDGRMISAFTDGGTVLWQRGVPGRPDPYLTVLDGDFLLSVSGGNTLSLINPGGLALWSVTLPFAVTAAPVSGRDGRIFVRGRKDISCYGIKGICKWHLSTDDQNSVPLQEFPDGSLVVFLMKAAGGKTSALRLSPFGELLEEITFAGTVVSASSCGAGILVSFSGGGSGLCILRNGKTADGWSAASPAGSFFLTVSESLASFIEPSGQGSRVSFINPATGKTSCTVLVPGVSCTSVISAKSYSDGVFFSDPHRSVFCSSDGSITWSSQLPSRESGRQQWNYLACSDDNHLILCGTSWAVSGYLMSQTTRTASRPEKSDSGYNDFYKQESDMSPLYGLEQQLDPGLSGSARADLLCTGMYGRDEIEWTSDITAACASYLASIQGATTGTRSPVTVFTSDMAGTDAMLRQLAYYGTSQFPRLIAKLLTAEKNRTHLRTLLEAAGECGYDPDGYLLDAVDRTFYTIPSTDDVLLTALCGTVYSLCRFMGRPAFFSHGRSILARLLYPQYSDRVRTCARKTLVDIGRLKL